MNNFLTGIMGKFRQQPQPGLNPNAPQTGLNQQGGMFGGIYGMPSQPSPLSPMAQQYSMEPKAYDAGMFGSQYSINPSLLDKPKKMDMGKAEGLLGGLMKKGQQTAPEAPQTSRPPGLSIQQLLAMYRGQNG